MFAPLDLSNARIVLASLSNGPIASVISPEPSSGTEKQSCAFFDHVNSMLSSFATRVGFPGLFFALLLTSSFCQADNPIPELRKALRSAVMAEDRLQTLQDLSEAYLPVNRDSAFYFAEQAVIVSVDLADVSGMARSQHLLGKAYSALDQWQLADSCFRISTENYLAMGELFGQADNFYALGETFGRQNLQDSADHYFDLALSYFDDSGDRGLAIDIHLQYSQLLLDWERHDSAMAQVELAGDMARSQGDQKRKAHAHALTGDIYSSRDQDRKALREYRKAHLIYDDLNLTERVARMLKCLALIHRKMGKGAVALDYAQRGLEKAHEAGSRPEAMDLYKLLSDLMADKEDFEAAYDYGRLHDMMRDSLLGDAAASDLASIVDKYEKEKLQLENEKIAQEVKLNETTIALQEEQLSVERTRLFALLGGLGLFLIFGIFLAIANVQKKRANKRLAEALDNLKRTQNQLVRSEKLASLGQVTAGIAHEIRNPLNFVNNLSRLSMQMVDELGEELEEIEGEPFEGENAQIVQEYFSDLKQNSGKINHHGERASRIVKDMLAHAGNGEKEKSDVKLNQLVEEYLQLAFQSYKSRFPDQQVGLEFEGDPEVGTVQAIGADLGRALLNLFSNAFDALRGSSAESPVVRVRTALAGGAVVVTVYDNGTGIADADLPRIFDPFFTTKPPNEGTGLGLSLAHETIVKAHGGSLTVKSEVGNWTEFKIVLPG